MLIISSNTIIEIGIKILFTIIIPCSIPVPFPIQKSDIRAVNYENNYVTNIFFNLGFSGDGFKLYET